MHGSNAPENDWRASETSETLSGIAQLKIANVCLFIYNMCGRTYVILYFDPHVILCSLRVQHRPYLHYTEASGLAISTYITLEIESFTSLNSFAGAVKLKNLWELHFYSS